MEVAPSRIMRRPVRAEPISVSSAGMVEDDSASPTSSSGPQTMFTTPAGSPICAHSSPTAQADSGDLKDGFTTSGQPAAMAGPILNARFSSGKFHAKKATATPAAS